jgi:hypothetical protein
MWEFEILSTSNLIMSSHLGSMILMHTTDISEGTRDDYHWTVASDDIQVSVHLLARHPRLAAVRAVDRELWTIEQVMMN